MAHTGKLPCISATFRVSFRVSFKTGVIQGVNQGVKQASCQTRQSEKKCPGVITFPCSSPYLLKPGQPALSTRSAQTSRRPSRQTAAAANL